MKLYHIYNHHMNMMGLIVPDIYQYIRTLITKINECIDIYIKNNKRPYPRDILSYIGQNYRELNFDGILYNVIELLMKEKGVKVKSGYPDELESIDRNEINSLSDVAKKALDILNVSDEELKAKEEEKLLRLMGMAPKTKKLKQNNQEE